MEAKYIYAARAQETQLGRNETMWVEGYQVIHSASRAAGAAMATSPKHVARRKDIARRKERFTQVALYDNERFAKPGIRFGAFAPC